jgi:hypothetical protein
MLLDSTPTEIGWLVPLAATGSHGYNQNDNGSI